MNIKSKRHIIAFLMLSLILLLEPVKGFSASVTEITRKLTCGCGCNLVISACIVSMECSTSTQITGEVENMLKAGKTEDEIIKYYVAKYGEKILATPGKQGFNFMAWIIPFFTLIVGVGGIYFFINRALGSKKLEQGTNGEPTGDTESDKQYREQLERELDSYKL